MKKRILSILLILCMVLMLVPATAFADEGYYTITQNFKYGAYQRAGVKVETSPYTYEQPAIATVSLGTVIDCAPYKFVGWKETSSGMVYEPNASILPESNLTFEAVYEVDGSLAITVDGFQVGNTPEDITYSFASTNLGVTFGKGDVEYAKWLQYDDESDRWEGVGSEAFQADKRYQLVLELNRKGLSALPAVTINGKTPECCEFGWSHIWIECEFGTPAPAPTIAIDGPDVVCAQQDYEFTVTPPAGVTLDKKFGHQAGYGDSDIELTIDEDGVGHGVVPAAYYESAIGSFHVIAHGTTANGTPVSATKAVQVSPEHIYVDGVCGCGAVQQYTVTYDGGEGSDPVTDVKTHGEPLTLRGETFKMDGFVQTGWVDKETDAAYRLGDTYTENADVTLNPVFEKIITLTVPYTTTVALGDVGVPGEKTFTLALIGDSAPDKDKSNVTITGSVTTNGKGSYNGTLTFTGTERTLWAMLSEGAFVQQVDDGEAGWTVDDTVWGVLMDEIPVAYAMGDDANASGYTVYAVPASIDGNGYYYIDWENLQTADMRFTNTYTAHAYELKHDATHHWDECQCKDVQNKELHKYGDWKVTKEATETAKGEKEHTCTVCGYTEKAEIPVRTNVQTGDNSSFALWAALFTLSAAAVTVTATMGKRKKAGR